MRQLAYHPESGTYWISNDPLSGPDFDQGVYELQADEVPAGVKIKTGISHSTSRPSMDFETYSEAGFVLDPIAKTVVSAAGPKKIGGLPVVGTPNYACHPSTEVICLYYDLKDGQGRRGWIPGGPLPRDLIAHIANGGEVEAFNFTFEWWIWNVVCVRDWGFPPMQFEQGFCVMAKARRNGLPGSLANVAKALGTVDKDKKGKQLIQKLCRPHKPTKKRTAFRWTPATAWEDFVGIYGYCDNDVLTEDEANARIPDLTDSERATWLVDQYVNARGVQVDIAALDAMLEKLEQAERKFTMELVQLTQGAVASVSEVAKFLEWLASKGVQLPDMKAETIEEALQWQGLASEVRRALEIRECLSSANVKKLRKVKHQVSSDGRLRNQYMYCGADQTGRWSSAAADDNASNSQLQNITAKGPKSQECQECGRITGLDHQAWVMGTQGGCPNCGGTLWKKCPEWTVEAVEFAVQDLITLDLDQTIALWGDPIALMCGCLRGMFVSAPGKDLICADFSAIEAVVLACLSRCQWRIDVFNDHGKIYEMSASKITGTPFEEYMEYKRVNKMHHPDRKKIGKVAELASGYGGWIGAWKAFGADEHFSSDNEIKEKVIGWRDASPEIVEFWGGQHRQVGPKPWDSVPELFGLEGAAIAAIQNPGQYYQVLDITFACYENILYCRLPSGRFLHYHEPILVPCEDHFRRPSLKITFMGNNTNTAKGPKGWQRLETYGGRLCENIVQAVSADIQAEAMKRAEAANYPVVMHTHDELTTEVPEGWGSVEELCAIMSQRPEWASWWPIKAAGWRHKRYQKD